MPSANHTHQALPGATEGELTEVFFHWDDVSTFEFIPVIYRGRCPEHREARKRYWMASFWYSLDATKGLRRSDCKAMTQSKNAAGRVATRHNWRPLPTVIL